MFWMVNNGCDTKVVTQNMYQHLLSKTFHFHKCITFLAIYTAQYRLACGNLKYRTYLVRTKTLEGRRGTSNMIILGGRAGYLPCTY